MDHKTVNNHSITTCVFFSLVSVHLSTLSVVIASNANVMSDQVEAKANTSTSAQCRTEFLEFPV